MSFFNPYLKRGNGRQRLEKKHLNFTRLIPKFFKDGGGEDGVYSISTNIPPTYFMGDLEYKVFPTTKTSMWNQTPIPANTECLSGELCFHVYDIIETVYDKDRCDEVPFYLQTDIIPCGIVLKLFGRTSDDRSVCVNVFGQNVYFYAYSEADSYNIHHIVQQTMYENSSRQCNFNVVKTKRKFLDTFDTAEHEVYKITLSSYHMMAILSNKLRQCGYLIFEANVDAVSRFITDNDFCTFAWYSCKSAMPRLGQFRDSYTSLEFDCKVSDLNVHRDKNYWPHYKIMAFDIECLGEQGFPNAARDGDMIIQISCIIWTLGQDDNYDKILLSLGTCSPITNTTIYSFPSELDMLYAFCTMIRDYDVEIITGYNIANFDFPYILERANTVYNINPDAYTRTKSGAIFQVNKPKEGNFLRSNTKVKLSGLVVIDMYMVCKDKLSLSNYKLNTVAKECIGEKKEDMSYKEIPALFKGNANDRARLGLYCIQDSILVMDLLKFFMTHIEISEIAKIANIPMRRVITDGQQIRVFSCLLASAKNRGYILPMPQNGNFQGYQGATVIAPLSGFYNTPVLVVDFASLYPSIIQAHNLCYSTLIHNEDLHKYPQLKEDDYETFLISSGPVHFVKKHISESLLSNLLTTWLAKRKMIRKELTACADPKLRTILDKQQLAIKVTCNAVYGFTGVASGMLPCLKIAETITMQGRAMLEKTKVFVENLSHEDLRSICKVGSIPQSSNVFDKPFKVIYGDTDSLFINCPKYNIDQIVLFGDELAQYITERLFVSPIKLESEKVFGCLLLLTKKRYIGTLSSGKILMKGVDLVRKTACTYVQETCRAVLHLVLNDNTVKEAANLLSKRKISKCFEEGLPEGFIKIIDILNAAYKDLSANRVPIQTLVYSTELNKDFSCYKSYNLPHLAVYKKIILRNEEPPQVHDRISYVFINGKGSLISDMAEDPAFVEANRIPIASDLYFDKIVHGVANILQCLFENNTAATVNLLYNFVTTRWNPH
ncbi:DNA polymerase [Porcine lymphotropic herpesvirus 2]|uniref:DNA polymerase n=2 Tax=Suid gammaherpesvirus 4 TaxID=1960250 RepID=Q772U4_9GAMA|nr:DNA polymerase [Porcine lymphotropic herpesvirus 2]AAF16522.1 DNA-dependent DNA polymerase [Porcine lymphotropic herpesvirus 2]AAO12354.1 DNA polymerase [Porcine lymphotropic herpesvirus 2]